MRVGRRAAGCLHAHSAWARPASLMRRPVCRRLTVCSRLGRAGRGAAPKPGAARNASTGPRACTTPCLSHTAHLHSRLGRAHPPVFVRPQSHSAPPPEPRPAEWRTSGAGGWRWARSPGLPGAASDSSGGQWSYKMLWCPVPKKSGPSSWPPDQQASLAAALLQRVLRMLTIVWLKHRRQLERSVERCAARPAHLERPVHYPADLGGMRL